MLSITIRPRDPKWIEQLEQQAMLYMEKTGDYIIGKEDGGVGETPNHLQIAHRTQTRTDNWRRNFLTQLKNSECMYEPEDDDESAIWLKVSQHREPDYLVGYCMKEGNYESTFEEEYLLRCADEYEQRQADEKLPRRTLTGGYKCTSINNLFNYIWSEGYHCPNLKFKHFVIKEVAKGNIPFSMGRKIRKEDEVFWGTYLKLKCREGYLVFPNEVDRHNAIDIYIKSKLEEEYNR